MGDEAIRNSSVSTGDDRDFWNFGVSFGDDAIPDSCANPEFWKIGVSVVGDDALLESSFDRGISNSRWGDSAISESLCGGSPSSKDGSCTEDEPMIEDVLLATGMFGETAPIK